MAPAALGDGVDCTGTDGVALAVEADDTDAGVAVGGSADLEACGVTVPLLVTAAAAVGRVRLAMKLLLIQRAEALNATALLDISRK